MDQINLAISPIQGQFKGMLHARKWTVRLHLPKGETLQTVWLNDRQNNRYKLITRNETDENAMPFNGEGDKPRKHAGQILKIPIEQMKTTETILVKVKLSGTQN